MGPEQESGGRHLQTSWHTLTTVAIFIFQYNHPKGYPFIPVEEFIPVEDEIVGKYLTGLPCEACDV